MLARPVARRARVVAQYDAGRDMWSESDGTKDMTEIAKDVYISRLDTDEWERDREVGGSAHLLFEASDGSTVGLWRAEPDDPPGPAPAVMIPLRETILVLEGSVRIGIDGGAPLELAAREMVSIPKGSMVAWDPSPDCKVFWVYS